MDLTSDDKISMYMNYMDHILYINSNEYINIKQYVNNLNGLLCAHLTGLKLDHFYQKVTNVVGCLFMLQGCCQI